jgi:hypothetical protein
MKAHRDTYGNRCSNLPSDQVAFGTWLRKVFSIVDVASLRDYKRLGNSLYAIQELFAVRLECRLFLGGVSEFARALFVAQRCRSYTRGHHSPSQDRTCAGQTALADIPGRPWFVRAKSWGL